LRPFIPFLIREIIGGDIADIAADPIRVLASGSNARLKIVRRLLAFSAVFITGTTVGIGLTCYLGVLVMRNILSPAPRTELPHQVEDDNEDEEEEKRILMHALNESVAVVDAGTVLPTSPTSPVPGTLPMKSNNDKQMDRRSGGTHEVPRMVYDALYHGGEMKGWLWTMHTKDYDGRFSKEWPPSPSIATRWFAVLDGTNAVLVLSENEDGSGG